VSVPARLGAFALALAATFGGGAALGATFGPDDPAPTTGHDQPHAGPAPTATLPPAAATDTTTTARQDGSHP